MILKFKVQGYKSYVWLLFKMGFLFTVLMVPFSLLTDVHAFPQDPIKDIAVLGSTYFLGGFLAMWLSTEYQFRERTDLYIFQGYFPIELEATA